MSVMKKEQSNKEKSIFLNIYSSIVIMLSITIFADIYHCRYEQEYGVNGYFTLRELLEVLCIICTIITLFYAVKVFLKTEIEEKIEVLEKVIAFLFISSFLLFIFGWYFGLWEKNSESSIPFSYLPLFFWGIVFLLFIKEKKDYIRDKNFTSKESENLQ